MNADIHRTPEVVKKIMNNRYGGVALICFPSLALALLTRIFLLIKAYAGVAWGLPEIAAVFGCGLLYDLAVVSYLSIPLVVYLAFLPDKVFCSRLHWRLSAVFFFLTFFALLSLAVAEWLFWDEFATRFNFIAVDYLVYTTEVLGNICESYPLVLIFTGLLLFCGLLFYGFVRTGWLRLWYRSCTPFKRRFVWGTGLLLLPLLFTAMLDNRLVSGFDNNFNAELARNGLYSLFAAFRNNELDYARFYEIMDQHKAFERLRGCLKTNNSTFLSSDTADITRRVENHGAEKRWNVIQITVESLSAKYMGTFGNRDDLTPNLDAIAAEGVLFTQFHATGTRTVRGMEALTLSLPPTPGRSIVKRPHNENLFSLGSVFRQRGYDTVFMYGGYGYFDNMNYFFSHNGYRVVDRAAVPGDAVTFANAWGACDGDLYNWVLEEADRAHACGKPFFHFVMTTSNHRPYTYPQGKIDIPSHSGRKGAVKYTDYAIGEFLRKARLKPWFADTVFVIVADHCAGSAGRTALPVNRYEIPLIIYNPGLFAPRRVETLCSQIDYAPTLLGLLNWSYQSRFYGKDVFRMQPEDERALLGNYQKLGLLTRERLVVLEPLRRAAVYRCLPSNGKLASASGATSLIADAIAYYQTAGYLFRHRPASFPEMVCNER